MVWRTGEEDWGHEVDGIGWQERNNSFKSEHPNGQKETFESQLTASGGIPSMQNRNF